MKSLFQIPTARQLQPIDSELRTPLLAEQAIEYHEKTEPVSMFEVAQNESVQNSTNSWVEVSSRQIAFNPGANHKVRTNQQTTLQVKHHVRAGGFREY